MANSMRYVLRIAQGRSGQPNAVILGRRTRRSRCESGSCASSKRRNDSKVHMALNTVRHLIDLAVTPVYEQECTQIQALCQAVQQVIGQTMELARADEGDTGRQARGDAKAEGIGLRAVKLPKAKGGSVLLPKRWVMGRSFGWLVRFRRLSRDFEHMPHMLAALHFVIFAPSCCPRLSWFWLQVHDLLYSSP